MSNTLYKDICWLHGQHYYKQEKAPETEFYQKLYAMPLDALRAERTFLIKREAPEGWTWLKDRACALYRPIQQGFLTAVQMKPGWSWYYSDTPDGGYVERGGGCLFSDMLDAAQEIEKAVLSPYSEWLLYRVKFSRHTPRAFPSRSCLGNRTDIDLPVPGMAVWDTAGHEALGMLIARLSSLWSKLSDSMTQKEGEASIVDFRFYVDANPVARCFCDQLLEKWEALTEEPTESNRIHLERLLKAGQAGLDRYVLWAYNTAWKEARQKAMRRHYERTGQRGCFEESDIELSEQVSFVGVVNPPTVRDWLEEECKAWRPSGRKPRKTRSTVASHEADR